jgi:uncharacterized protein (TIGR03643 family)
MSERIILTAIDIDRIIEMAWEDRTPFEAIKLQFGVTEEQVIILMRSELKLSSFKLWRERVKGRITKHKKLSNETSFRFKCSRQNQINLNKIGKR